MARVKGYAFAFPGQGSQRVGMFDAYTDSKEFGEIIAEASEVLGTDLRKLSEDQQAIDDTRNTQPLMLTVGVGAYRAWLAAQKEKPVILAGHSLGEYSALVAAGSITFADALQLVKQRAIAMHQATADEPGGMCAILGLQREQVENICRKLALNAWVANINTATQLVVAGKQNAVLKVANECRKQGAKRALMLPMSVPSHCPMMEPAARQLSHDIAQCPVVNCEIPVVQNATAKLTIDAEHVRLNLIAQLVMPLDWTACVKSMQMHANKIIECGPGKVLTGLHRRLIGAEASFAIDSSEAIATLQA